jgi:hypothetical protein
LDECYDLTLGLFDGPTKRGAHSFELDRRERLEVQNDSRISDEVRQVVNVGCDVNVDVVACLKADK